MFANLFARRRYYAQLDAQAVCVAVWALSQQPQQGCWVEINELQPRWIGKPLPAAARISRRETRASWRMLPA